MAQIAIAGYESDGDDIAAVEHYAVELSARAAQRLAALGEMTGGIAHDFRNILAVIESGLRLAERNADHPEKVRLFVAAAREGVERGTKLTSQLLSFAKEQELDAQATDANELPRNFELFLKYSANPDVHIVYELASNIPNCLINRSQFGAALLNLVVNARDAMPNGGDIRISTARYDMTNEKSRPGETDIYVRVSVKDTGQGMPANVLSKVFDPFFTTKGEKGTGLGLPQVYACMQRIGGHVRIRSEQGVGTSVDLFFPAAELTAGAVPRG